uniref:Uncharacterized protein n=1 Tax=Glossina palpalis gambiensis TaxID=67801 RepID=A0A1B0BZN2_9MUSC
MKTAATAAKMFEPLDVWETVLTATVELPTTYDDKETPIGEFGKGLNILVLALPIMFKAGEAVSGRRAAAAPADPPAIVLDGSTGASVKPQLFLIVLTYGQNFMRKL